jgi:hypothetical protein
LRIALASKTCRRKRWKCPFCRTILPFATETSLSCEVIGGASLGHYYRCIEATDRRNVAPWIDVRCPGSRQAARSISAPLTGIRSRRSARSCRGYGARGAPVRRRCQKITGLHALPPAVRHGDRVRLFTRRGCDWTARFFLNRGGGGEGSSYMWKPSDSRSMWRNCHRILN